METVPPPPPPFEPPAGPGERTVATRRRPWDDGAVVGGVARDLGARLGTDPLWVRLAFVLLTLFSGLGVILYAGLWCSLRGLRRGGLTTFWGLVGVGICVLGTLSLLGTGSTEYLGGPWSLVFALSGVAVALWAPRQATAAGWQPPDGIARTAGVTPPAQTVIGGLAVPPPPDGRLPTVTRRPASWLGRWTLAIALVVMLVGMVIDEANGGRLHPEQWLGAAAIVCGLGIVVSAWRGFAIGLVIPAAAFAGAGFVAGHAARVGLEEFTIGSQDYTIWADGGTDLPAYQSRTDVLAGEIDLWVDGQLADGVDAPHLRVAIGSVEIWTDDTIAVDVVGRVRSGTVLGPDGRERDSDGDWHIFRLGPDGPADVVIRAEVSIGDLRLHQITGLDLSMPRPPQVVGPTLVPTITRPAVTTPAAAGGMDIGGGLTMTDDGTVLFPNYGGDPYEQMWISPDGTIWGPAVDDSGANGVAVVYAGDGEYLVLPNQAILTPGGAVVDVAALRAERVARENPPEAETNRPLATSESVDDGALSVTTVATPTSPITSTTTRNEQD